MSARKRRDIGFTLIELLMASFVLSIVTVCLFRGITLFVQGAMKIQMQLPTQSALQMAGHMLTTDLSAASRCSVNNLLPNPGFEDDFVGALVETSGASTSTWFHPPYRMNFDTTRPYMQVRLRSTSWGNQKNLAIIGDRTGSPPLVSAITSDPSEIGERYLATFKHKLLSVPARVRVYRGSDPLVQTILLFQKDATAASVFATTFTDVTGGDYYRMSLTLISASGLSWAEFDNVYLGPMSVELSTSHPSGRLFFHRVNSDGEKEKVTYGMSVQSDNRGQLIRTVVRPAGATETSTISGIDFLKVSWLGAPSAVERTDRPLLVQMVGRGPTAKSSDAMSLQFEVYPNVE